VILLGLNQPSANLLSHSSVSRHVSTLHLIRLEKIAAAHSPRLGPPMTLRRHVTGRSLLASRIAGQEAVPYQNRHFIQSTNFVLADATKCLTRQIIMKKLFTTLSIAAFGLLVLPSGGYPPTGGAQTGAKIQQAPQTAWLPVRPRQTARLAWLPVRPRGSARIAWLPVRPRAVVG
jgi:hypothetical protein